MGLTAELHLLLDDTGAWKAHTVGRTAAEMQGC